MKSGTYGNSYQLKALAQSYGRTGLVISTKVSLSIGRRIAQLSMLVEVKPAHCLIVYYTVPQGSVKALLLM